MEKIISALALLSFSFFNQTPTPVVERISVVQTAFVDREEILAQKTMDLSTRHPDKWVNEVFSDNILLNLHYFHASLGEAGKVGRPSRMEGRASLRGDTESIKDEKGRIDWEKVRQPFEFSFALQPGQTFAYHKNLLPEFKDKDVLVGQSRFWFDEGYKSDGYLVGDGICHLASLFNWVSQEAGLEVKSMVNHDFLPVPEIPREYGTSILYAPDGSRNSANQNLYITNNFSYPVEFEIQVNGNLAEIKIVDFNP